VHVSFAAIVADIRFHRRRRLDGAVGAFCCVVLRVVQFIFPELWIFVLDEQLIKLFADEL
jgi:hypothetical protein